MALSRSTRVNLLIGNGHFLSHFYVLCLPPLFLAWQNAFHVSFAELPNLSLHARFRWRRRAGRLRQPTGIRLQLCPAYGPQRGR